MPVCSEKNIILIIQYLRYLIKTATSVDAWDNNIHLDELSVETFIFDNMLL